MRIIVVLALITYMLWVSHLAALNLYHAVTALPV